MAGNSKGGDVMATLAVGGALAGLGGWIADPLWASLIGSAVVGVILAAADLHEATNKDGRPGGQ